MSESRRRGYVATRQPRLPTVFGPPTPAAQLRAARASDPLAGIFVTPAPRHIGHGQQIAWTDAYERRRVAPMPEGRYTRQQDRRADYKRLKASRRRLKREVQAEQLATMRRDRAPWSTISAKERGVGRLTPKVRQFGFKRPFKGFDLSSIKNPERFLNSSARAVA